MSKEMNVEFKNFLIKKNRIEFDYFLIESSGRIFFELSDPVPVSNDAIVIALSTLCGRQYERIYFELIVSQNALNEIKDFTLSQIECLGIVESPLRLIKENSNEQDSVVLNFSGGFDSLAAMALMPSARKLVSMDFGGRFSREKEFFSDFDTKIVSTNILQTPLKKNSWSFMGIASILYGDYYSFKYITFGGILEAGISNFLDDPIAAKNITFPPFKAMGMENAPYVLGLTEVGTIKVVAKYYPNLIKKSLNSLANPGEEKRYRKQVLLDIFCNLNNKKIDYDLVDIPKKPYFKFGENFALDFLAIYIAKHAGIDVVCHTLSDVPDDILSLINGNNLYFYEKVNDLMLKNFPSKLVEDYLNKLAEAGVYRYDESDWIEFENVKKFLFRFHKK